MGLLDEAIREHLELKRRHGADPAEVAREQHEALDPVPGVQGQGDTDARGEELLGEDAGTYADVPGGDGDAQAPTAEGAPSAGASEPAGLEETVELDMNAVLDEQHVAAGPIAGEAVDVIDPLPGQEDLKLEHDPATDSAADN